MLTEQEFEAREREELRKMYSKMSSETLKAIMKVCQFQGDYEGSAPTVAFEELRRREQRDNVKRG